MKYIKLSDVQELIENMGYADNDGVVRILKNDLDYLPSIDPEELITKVLDVVDNFSFHNEGEEILLAKLYDEILELPIPLSINN